MKELSEYLNNTNNVLKLRTNEKIVSNDVHLINTLKIQNDELKQNNKLLSNKIEMLLTKTSNSNVNIDELNKSSNMLNNSIKLNKLNSKNQTTTLPFTNTNENDSPIVNFNNIAKYMDTMIYLQNKIQKLEKENLALKRKLKKLSIQGYSNGENTKSFNNIVNSCAANSSIDYNYNYNNNNNKFINSSISPKKHNINLKTNNKSSHDILNTYGIVKKDCLKETSPGPFNVHYKTLGASTKNSEKKIEDLLKMQISCMNEMLDIVHRKNSEGNYVIKFLYLYIINCLI